MKKINEFFSSKGRSGFTLIELIIVISIIGVLAAALLAALNPAEQINRSKDAGAQVAAKALLDAENRFYAQQGYFPWCASAADTACTNVSAGVAANSASWVGAGGVNAPTATSPQGRLESTGELKTGYLGGVTTASTMVLSGTGGVNGPGSSPVVCYPPTSSAQLAVATYNSTGGAWASGTKYICIR